VVRSRHDSVRRAAPLGDRQTKSAAVARGAPRFSHIRLRITPRRAAPALRPGPPRSGPCAPRR
jgi:hypothetical protein